MTEGNKTERLSYLDAARGIAALMVMAGHLINWKYPDKPIINAASVVLNANDAVSFFFVLSGMVLSYPYLQLGKRMDIGKFYVNRIFRIFPGFWLALLVNVWYVYRLDWNTTLLTDIFIRNRDQFWEEFLLIKGHNLYYLAGWTLTVELIFSFLMPFLVAMAKYNRQLIAWLIGISLVTAHLTGFFLFHFALGLFLGAYFMNYSSAAAIKSTWWYRYRYFLIPFALLIFSMRQWTKIWPVGGPTLHYTLNYLQLDFYHLSALASFIFIICLVHYRRLRAVFELPFLVYIGKISYGIYLMHWILVRAMGDYWDSFILPLFPGATSALLVSLAVCFVATILLASIVHYCVELPFIRLGKRVVKKMKPGLEI